MSVRAVPAEEAAAPLSRVLDFDTCGGLQGIAEILSHAQCFEIAGPGGPVAHYALHVAEHSGGVEATIIAAAGGVPGADLTATFIPVIERQVAGAAALTVHTRRRGLVAKLKAQGFAVEGFILRKKLA